MDTAPHYNIHTPHKWCRQYKGHNTSLHCTPNKWCRQYKGHSTSLHYTYTTQMVSAVQRTQHIITLYTKQMVSAVQRTQHIITLYIHHTNSRIWNFTAGVRPLNRNDYSNTRSTLDTMPYFPQQKELQYTIIKLDQCFLSRCENKTHKKEDMNCQSHILCIVHCAKKHTSLNSNLYNAYCHMS
jgi:hypothetical protein